MMDSLVSGLLVLATFWLAVWVIYVLCRNNTTLALRMQIIEFVYHQEGDWQDRMAWHKSLPSYDAMCPLWPFVPLTNKPLIQMIDGKYAEEFKFWRKDQTK